MDAVPAPAAAFRIFQTAPSPLPAEFRQLVGRGFSSDRWASLRADHDGRAHIGSGGEITTLACSLARLPCNSGNLALIHPTIRYKSRISAVMLLLLNLFLHPFGIGHFIWAEPVRTVHLGAEHCGHCKHGELFDQQWYPSVRLRHQFRERRSRWQARRRKVAGHLSIFSKQWNQRRFTAQTCRDQRRFQFRHDRRRQQWHQHGWSNPFFSPDSQSVSARLTSSGRLSSATISKCVNVIFTPSETPASSARSVIRYWSFR